ncbi:glycosyltransferase [Streptosporangium roseum]|uniref:glycosyltransferase n=1 Tax=Streptosporangium roseum TaxID=2001 RepID=UPI003320FDB3
MPRLATATTRRTEPPAGRTINTKLTAARGEQAGLRRDAFHIGQPELGSAEKQLSLLARELRLRSVEVHVVQLSKGGPHDQPLSGAGIGVRRLGFGRKPSGLPAPGRNLAAFARLVVLLRGLRTDVLQGCAYESYMIGTVAARLARVPIAVAGHRGLRSRPRSLAEAITHLLSTPPRWRPQHAPGHARTSTQPP